MSEEKRFEVSNPILILFEQGGHMFCHVYKPEGWTHLHFGTVLADLVRHIADAFEVSEAQVLDAIHCELERPTGASGRVS